MEILAYLLYSIFISLSPVAEKTNWEKDLHVQCQSYLRVNKRGRGGVLHEYSVYVCRGGRHGYTIKRGQEYKPVCLSLSLSQKCTETDINYKTKKEKKNTFIASINYELWSSIYLSLMQIK